MIIVTVKDSDMKYDRLACFVLQRTRKKNQFSPVGFPHLVTIVKVTSHLNLYLSLTENVNLRFFI